MKGLREKRQDPNFYFHHMGANRIRENIGDDVFYRYRRLACVRNPFKRLISQFFYKSVWLANEEAPKELAQAKEQFREFMMSDATDRSNKKRIKSDEYLTHIDGNMILTDILRLENFSDDLKAFLQKIGWVGNELSIPHIRDNSSKKIGRKVMDFFDADDLVKRAIEIDGWMFDLGGYSKDPRDADIGNKIVSQ